jgi:hypothetical protein
MTFAERIADAQSIGEVFELVNEFLNVLHHTGAIDQIPPAMRPGHISADDDLAYWLTIMWDEIESRDAANEDTPDIIYGIHAVLETAQQRMRSGWHH